MIYFIDEQILALILLPFLFKKIQKLTKKSSYGKSWFPEKNEVLDTFVYHIKVNIFLLILKHVYGSVPQKRATERARCLFRVKGALFNSLIIVCCVFEKKIKDLYR